MSKKDIKGHDGVVRIREKGANGINAASVETGENIIVTAGCEVHSHCRKWYMDSRDIRKSLNKSKG